MPQLEVEFRNTASNFSSPALPESTASLLHRIGHGEREAFDRLMPLIYRDLRSIAERHLRREASNHTLQPTALIHEAYLRLVNYEGYEYRDRTHFLAVAARVMRQILVDHARARLAAKRGNPAMKITLHEDVGYSSQRSRVLLALDDALNALAKLNQQRAHFVELRFFGGMTAENIAEFVAMPVHKVRRELLIAQAWLRREIEA